MISLIIVRVECEAAVETDKRQRQSIHILSNIYRKQSSVS